MTDRSDTNPSLPRGRWRRQPEVRPQQILEAAFRIFGSRGLHGATLDEVAREAGISKGTIYLYFPDKVSLFTAMMHARVNGVMPPEPVTGRAPTSAQAQLLRIGRRLYRFFCTPAFLALYRTIIGEAPQFPDAAATLYRDGILPSNRRLATVFEAGIASGEFRRGLDPLVAARAFVGMLQIFAVSQVLLGGQRILPLAPARVVATVMDLLFHGLLAAAPRRSTGVRR